MVTEYTMQYGRLFLQIAYEALSNAADVINCEKPARFSSIALDWGITRQARDGSIEYCCRAKFLQNHSKPYVGSETKLAREFNAVAVCAQIPQRFTVKLEPYPPDSKYVVIVARPI